ncbi:MAG: extracellular solute-binding protein [Lachnospiraceae bacterium]|nr:extracellular solute-binding protein [Lachnospiraceae bacterium]
MRRGKKTRLAALMLALILLTSGMTVSATGSLDETSSDKTEDVPAASEGNYITDEDFSNEMIEKNYTVVDGASQTPYYQGRKLEYQIQDVFRPGIGAVTASDNFGYSSPVPQLTVGDSGKLVIEAPETARYLISLDYLDAGDTVLPIEFSMMVNGDYQFYELRDLTFEAQWEDPEEISYDRYGNQIVPVPEKIREWENKYIMDSTYRHTSPLAVELKKGENELDITMLEGTVLLGNLYLEPVSEADIPAYEGAQEAMAGDKVITLQGENMYRRNASSIRAACEYNINLDPYEVKTKALNTIDSESFSDAGSQVTYQFEVEEEGVYYLAMNYLQSEKADFPVFVNVEVDGRIPNDEFFNYALKYGKKYQAAAFKDQDDNSMGIYLEKGVHTVSFTIAADPLCKVLEGIDEIMSGVNSLNLQITKVAGTNKDKYRDLDIESYIPDAVTRLNEYADKLDSLCESMLVYTPGVKEIGAFSSAQIASEQLRSLASEPDQLAYRVSELTTSTNSVNQFLANLIDNLNKNELAIDRIYIYQKDAKLPGNAGIVKSVASSVKRFVTSFASQAYSTGNTNEEHLQVWVNRSRQYLEIMQKMIDEDFTPKTGIEVDLALMPDQNKLILANASGDAPDIATGINYAVPFELGIRGALKDLTEFDDFADVAERFEEGLLIPSTIDDGIYSLPETMNFWVLYVRTDIFDQLGLEIPDTIQDVKNLLPSLQMRGMNFYYPTAGMLSMRNFHGTTPLILQNGGSLYKETAGDSNLTSEESVKGFKELTELFTIYNLPKDIPNFYQHFRNGSLPIGIADYAVYNMLLNAAPEIANSWTISPVPGVEDENGNVSRYISGGAESTVMFESGDEREAQAWEFMKWWSSTEVQAEFGQTLQITYGSTYMWNTANKEAFGLLPWKTIDKNTILEQAEWIYESPRLPGSYMVEREISNAYNSIVVDGKNLRRTLDNATKRINRETERKLEEFGYNDANGNVITPYVVPTLDRVEEILNECALGKGGTAE